ncbi:hypothetical protein IV203_031103 [Nitzschia inconspicua]|uniref:Uncharacterized protein n=1 Tax=Nitzschia inconspicua TaxID=303405 RepID=A0A9K3LTN7_9STRA|nr:hypothetical protein IV203_031103 [Nitzschia inconspicua]
MTSNKDVSHLAFAVLTAMKQSFQTRISIKTNANKELYFVQAPTKDADFQELFCVSHRRGNKAKRSSRNFGSSSGLVPTRPLPPAAKSKPFMILFNAPTETWITTRRGQKMSMASSPLVSS